MTRFTITENSLYELKAENVPNNVLRLLESIKDRELKGKKEFLESVKTAVGEEETETYEPLILKHADKLTAKKEKELRAERIQFEKKLNAAEEYKNTSASRHHKWTDSLNC